jgi:hypothetical protein
LHHNRVGNRGAGTALGFVQTIILKLGFKIKLFTSLIELFSLAQDFPSEQFFFIFLTDKTGQFEQIFTQVLLTKSEMLFNAFISIYMDDYTSLIFYKKIQKGQNGYKHFQTVNFWKIMVFSKFCPFFYPFFWWGPKVTHF